LGEEARRCEEGEGPPNQEAREDMVEGSLGEGRWWLFCCYIMVVRGGIGGMVTGEDERRTVGKEKRILIGAVTPSHSLRREAGSFFICRLGT